MNIYKSPPSNSKAMKKLLSLNILFALLVVSGAGIAYAQTATITSFDASSYTVVTGATSNLTWAGSAINNYRLYIVCPSGISAILEKDESCNISTPLGQNTSALLKFTNTTSYTQQVTVKLQAYGSFDKPDQESQLTIAVSPTAQSGTAIISFFHATSNSVSSGGTVSFSWAGSNVDHYQMYFVCPSNSSVILEKQEVCGQTVSVGLNTSESAKFTNNSQGQQQVTVELRAYGQNDKYDSREVAIINVSLVSGSTGGGTVEGGGNAKINSFTLDKTTVSTGFNNNKPTAQFTAFFSGANTDTWKITLDCPLPTTVRGLEERIDLIKTGGAGVSSPSKEGQQCNITQEGSASLTQFTFLLINPFATPQSVTLTLGAYSWDGTKNIRGDVQSKTLTVLPN